MYSSIHSSSRRHSNRIAAASAPTRQNAVDVMKIERREVIELESIDGRDNRIRFNG
jgi:hypothetical protein